jgi:hypothetical protein
MLFAGTSGKLAETSVPLAAFASYWKTWPVPTPSSSVKRREKPLTVA